MHTIHLVSYIAIVAVLLFVILAVAAHLLQLARNPLRDSLSTYALGGRGAVMVVALLAIGVAALAVSVDLARELGAHGGGKRVLVGVAFEMIFAAGIIVAALVKRPLAGEAGGAARRVHGVALALAYGGIVLAIVAVSPVFRNVQEWRGVASALQRLELPVVVLALFTLLARIPGLRVIYGLAERLFLLSCAGWLLAVGIQLARIRG